MKWSMWVKIRKKQFKASAAFSQINHHNIFPDDFQQSIVLMYLENYWLLYSNRQNTVNG